MMTSTDSTEPVVENTEPELDDGPARKRELMAGAAMIVFVAAPLFGLALSASSIIATPIPLAPGGNRDITVRFHHKTGLPEATTGVRVLPAPGDTAGPLRVALLRSPPPAENAHLRWIVAQRGTRHGVRLSVEKTGIEQGRGFARVRVSVDREAPPGTYHIGLRAWYEGYATIGKGLSAKTVSCPQCLTPTPAPSLTVTVIPSPNTTR